MGSAAPSGEPTPRFAIVGYAARLPGAADAGEYWELLSAGRDAISEVPADRWDVDAFFDPDPAAPGKVVTRRAGFVDDATGFDAPFFGMSTREVQMMDPQHRLLLETAWRAVEHSGTAPSALANTRTGVFVGLATHDYLGMASDGLTYPEIEAYLAIGTSNAAAAGRISYRLGLQGPAVAVDTACSSSLVAIHQACQALQLGECDIALAGGANVMLTPATMITFSNAHMLAPDGRCKTFDAAADGYVRGEGCGIIVVKRLDDAVRDGDRIRAVIRGSAINQDGASGGLTVPNGVAQQRVIADALKRAGLAPADVDYLEAHGTGTSLGDPIEAQAAGAALGAGRDPNRPLLIGSAKTNIGHLEAAAGIAGVLKVVLALEHETLPKHLNFETPSPHIPWDRLPVEVVKETVPWRRGERPRIAGVSSFGFAGTNAHVILEEAPVAPEPAQRGADGRFDLLPISARTPGALARLATDYRTWLTEHPDATLADVCLTAGTARSHLEHRAAIVANSRDSAIELLGALADDRPAPGLVRGESYDTPKTAWLFTGQGSQYPGMARELFDTEPVFAETVHRCADAVAGLLEKPLLDVIFDVDDEDTLRQTTYAQPALFAVEMGLARLWQSWGFEPDVVLGHSVGQYSAACVAGVFGLEDGARLMAERGRVFGSLPAGGRMVAIFAPAERVEGLTDDFPALSVAAYNGANTVLSGPAADLENVVAALVADGVRCDWLETSHAFHSALLDPILDDFEAFADELDVHAPQRILIDNRTGAAIGRSVRLDGAYWRRHARQPVEFAKSVRTLAEMNCKLLVEIGPRPVLTAAALSAWPDPATTPRVIASLRRTTADQRQITEALADAYVFGHLPAFGALGRPGARKVDLPTYPFEHRRYWFTDKQDQGSAAPAPVSRPGQGRTETVRLLEDGRIEELAALLGGTETDPETLDVLNRLAAQHNQQRSTESIAHDRYRFRWEPSTAGPLGADAGEDITWVVVGDDSDATRPLFDVLAARGSRYRIVGLPKSDAEERELADALRAVAAEAGALRLVHVAALDGAGAGVSMRSLLRMQHRILGGTRRLFRAAVAAELRAPVWLVTRGAQHVTDSDTVAPDQSCLWGFGRAASLEHPQLWGGLADLSPTGTADEWSRLLNRLAAPHDPAIREDQIALRDQTVYVPRLVRRDELPSGRPLGLRDDASYLVTGGLGSIGLEVAGYLAAQGARNLVLTSRRTPGDAARQRIDALRAQYGAQVRVVAADVADAHDVARLLDTVQAELPPLAGIVHAAGEIGTTPLAELDDAEVDRVFAGKVWGAWHLSEAAADLQLDFFIGTSSIASVWGGYGQTAYGAANAFLDGLAWRLREQGIPGVSVNFGPWAAGMADAQSRARLEQRGIKTLSPADALAGLSDVVTGAAAQGVVARIDWERFLPLYQQAGRRGFLADLEREVPAAVVAATPSGRTALVERLTNAPVQQRKRMLTDYLRDAVAEVTRVDAAEIREDAGFFDLGMDSLMAVELRRRIEQGIGKEVPVTLVMDQPRLSDAADYLLGDVLGLREPAQTREVASVGSGAADEPIAIVAVSCRFPGAPDPDAFWDLLAGGVDAIREVPEDRFDIDEFYDPDPDAAGKTYTRYGGFLDGIDEFDPEFFGISPREAVWIEPQQRLMLETVWEGLERAGYAPSALRGSRTGVFVGVAANEYAHLLSAESIDKIEPHFITGNALNAISGRVAFALGLEGPAVAVDTACSSSLVAVHQATQALRSGDCDMALAGGVNVLLSPVTVVAASRARMLSPVGRCKTFDASADGYVRSEGCGVLVLKRLSDAVRDGDRVRAVIASSAVNQDGASSGLTVPNGGAQQRLIGSVLARAGLTGADVDYLEAHGTGTPLGDPIEVQAAAAAYGGSRDPARPLLMGSVKTNIGHTESASGAAGLIKVVLALQHGTLPQSLHFDTPSPHIPWDSLPVRVVDKAIPWQADGRPRRAGVSSFGFTGTNAHVLIEEAPPELAAREPAAPAEPADDESAAPEQVHVLALSARSPEALVELANRYDAWLSTHPDADLADVCLTAGTGRSHFEHRAALVVDSVDSARIGLSDLAQNRLRPGVVRGEHTQRPTTAWLFTGQGSQYPGMARELFDSEPVFAETVTRCADAVADLLPRPLLDVLFSSGREAGVPASETLRHTSFAQPALFAVEMGLARLWQSWGVEPDVVLGHSVGQYAAACVAGVFSLEDGARLMAQRGRLFGSLPEGGRMVAVFTDAKRVEEVAGGFPRVSVGAYNGPNTVLSGPGDDLEQIVTVFGEDGIRCTWLETSHAFHSELLEPVLDEFESCAAQLEFAAPTLPLVCNRTGAVLTGQATLDAPYWRRHSRQPVQFAESVRTVAALGASVLMEIGPQPVLTGAAVQVWPEHLPAPRAVASLRKGVADRRQIADALAAAYIGGHRPDFAALHREHGNRLEMPTYPFQRRRFWPKSAGMSLDGGGASMGSGILGSGKDLASGDSVYTSRLSVKSQPWLSDHVIYGTVVVPGATYAAMALAAVGTPAHAKDVFFYEPIILPEKSSREVQLTLHPVGEGEHKFQVHSRPYGERGAEWSLNAEGVVANGAGEAPGSDGGPVDEAIERLNRMRPQDLFETFADLELAWGPTWSGSLKSLWLGDGEAIGDILVGAELAEQLGTEPMHPVLMDLCTGVAFPAFPALLAAEQGVNDLYLPLRYGQVSLAEKMPRRFYCRARWHEGPLDSETQVFDIDYLDRDGHRLGGITEFTVKRAPREALLRGLGGDATRLLYTLGWHEVPVQDGSQEDSVTGPAGTWLVGGFAELAAAVPGCIAAERSGDREPLGQMLIDAHERGLPFSGVVWRAAPAPALESGAETAARLEAEIADLLSAVHTLQGSDLKLPGGLWIVTERAVATESAEPVDPVQAALWGFGRTTINEEPALRCRLVDSDGSAEAVQALAGLLAAPVDEPELAVRQGKLLASRLLPWSRSGHLTVPRGGDFVLAPTERGAIDNLRLTETEVPPPDEGYVQVRVEAAGLNFRDVLNVLGLYPGDPGPIGGDFAGVITQLGDGVTGLEVGQRVYGSMQGAFASRFNVPEQFVAPIPDGVSAVEAATIPAAALTVRLSFDWAALKPGDKVLIHAASGGVGLAAVQMAQRCGATVFATASTFKRATLRKLGVEHVYDSRTTEFADQILADTDGAGVDVVLNSLTSEGFIEATLRATAQGGRFAEIAKRDIWPAERMAEARPDLAYEIVALDTVMFTEPDRIRDLLTEVSEGLAGTEWTPLPAEVYPLTEARAAFRRMQQARHIGKIVVQIPNPLQPQQDRSYLVTGGLGAIGLHTAAYLAQLGAGDIVLTSRRAADAHAEQVIADIAERYKTRLHVFTADVGNEDDVIGLLARIRAELPPLAGVVHLAGVLDDALLSQQSVDRFRTTLAPKAFGACHLDRLTRDDDLDFFIVSSSVSSLFGSPGQSNYATANALLDGLVAARRAQGLPATGVNFGPWAQGGMASSEAAAANITAQGLIPLEPSAALAALAEVVANGTAQATVLKANWARAAKVLGSSRPPLLDLVLPSAAGEMSGDSELLKQLQEIPVPQRAGFVTEFLQKEVQNFLRLAQPPAASARFLDLGTDSLMAIELRNRLHSQFGGAFTINATAVFDYPTIGGLAEYLVGQLPDAEAPAQEAGPDVTE